MSRLNVLRMRSPLDALAPSAAAAFIAICPCLSLAQGAQSADPGAPAFEVASIKSSGPIDPLRARAFDLIASTDPFMLFAVSGQRVEVRGTTAAQLVAVAYRMPVREIVGPAWISDARFDIEALIPSGEHPDKIPEMLRTLLEQRLAFKAHREVRNIFGYSLSTEKGGPKLQEASPPVSTNPLRSVRKIKRGYNGTQMDYADMAQLVSILARELGAQVNDQTGIKGHYAIVLQFPNSEPQDELSKPALYKEALEAYGLKLVPGKIDVPFLVIDNLAKNPKEN